MTEASPHQDLDILVNPFFPGCLVTLDEARGRWICRLSPVDRIGRSDAIFAHEDRDEAVRGAVERLWRANPEGLPVELKEDSRCWGVVRGRIDDGLYAVSWYGWDRSRPGRNDPFPIEALQPQGTHLSDLDEVAFLAHVRAHNEAGLQVLVEQGVFDGQVDGTPLPLPIRFSIADLGAGATMAKVAVDLGIMPSLARARRNGWDRPLVLGRQALTKKRILIEIVP